MNVAADSAPLFRADGLRVTAGPPGNAKTILDDVSFQVAAGGFTGLIGETGSGKSVTLRTALRMLPNGVRMEAGSSAFDGRTLQEMSPADLRRMRGREIGFVPQQPWSALNPVQTIERQFIDVARSHGHTARWAREHARQALERVEIRHVDRVMRGYVGELSGGMAQRVLIAMAILLSPRLLVADEPTTALDVTVQREILQLIRGICQDDGTGVLIVTHDLGVVANFCEDVYVMHSGRMLESGPVSEVFSVPKHEYTRELVEASTRHVRDDDLSARSVLESEGAQL